MIPFGSDFTISLAGLSISVILLIWKIWKYWWAVKMYTKAQGEFYPGINSKTPVLIWKVLKILQVTVQKILPSVGCSWTLLFCSSEIAAASVTFCIDILRPTAIFRKSIVADLYCNPCWILKEGKIMVINKTMKYQHPKARNIVTAEVRTMTIHFSVLPVHCPQICFTICKFLILISWHSEHSQNVHSQSA